MTAMPPITAILAWEISGMLLRMWMTALAACSNSGKVREDILILVGCDIQKTIQGDEVAILWVAVDYLLYRLQAYLLEPIFHFAWH